MKRRRDVNLTRTGIYYTSVNVDGQILGINYGGLKNHYICPSTTFNIRNPHKFQDVNIWAGMWNKTQQPAANAKIRNLLINGEHLSIY